MLLPPRGRYHFQFTSAWISADMKCLRKSCKHAARDVKGKNAKSLGKSYETVVNIAFGNSEHFIAKFLTRRYFWSHCVSVTLVRVVWFTRSNADAHVVLQKTVWGSASLLLCLAFILSGNTGELINAQGAHKIPSLCLGTTTFTSINKSLTLPKCAFRGYFQYYLLWLPTPSVY